MPCHVGSPDDQLRTLGEDLKDARHSAKELKEANEELSAMKNSLEEAVDIKEKKLQEMNSNLESVTVELTRLQIKKMADDKNLAEVQVHLNTARAKIGGFEVQLTESEDEHTADMEKAQTMIDENGASLRAFYKEETVRVSELVVIAAFKKHLRSGAIKIKDAALLASLQGPSASTLAKVQKPPAT